MQRKELLKSQRELVRLKIANLSTVQADVQNTVNTVATELGLDIKENWRLSDDGCFFEKIEPPKK